MSPAQKLETPGIDSVAVIGAGPCGLAAAKYVCLQSISRQLSLTWHQISLGREEVLNSPGI